MRVLVFENGSKLDWCNYRPISSLSNAGKVLEKSMNKRVYNFLTENVVIYAWQKFSSSHALINLTKNIRQAFDEGYTGCSIFLELQKAFDIVDHKYCYLNLTTPVFEAYQITGLNPAFVIANNLFL